MDIREFRTGLQIDKNTISMDLSYLEVDPNLPKAVKDHTKQRRLILLTQYFLLEDILRELDQVD